MPIAHDGPARVLLTDGEERATLAAGRSLRRAGYRVSYAASAHPAPVSWSRSADRRHVYAVPDPRREPASFVAALAAIVSAEEHVVLLAGGDASLLAISRYRDQLDPWVHVGLPSHATVEMSMSKMALIGLARSAGLGAPETLECYRTSEALASARMLGFPVALKPPSTVLRVGDSVRQRSSIVVADEACLKRFADECGEHCLVQRKVAGPVYSFFGVAAHGALLAYGLSRYRRTWPVQGGNVASARTAPAPPELVNAVGSLLRALTWEGIFELELIRDREGKFVAIDFNPRLYGSLALSVAASAPLPAIWCDWLLSGVAPAQLTARPGVNYRWEDAEARHFLWQLRRRRLRAAAGVLSPLPSTVHAHFSWSDPLPMLARLAYLARSKERRRVPVRARPPDRCASPLKSTHDDLLVDTEHATPAGVN